MILYCMKREIFLLFIRKPYSKQDQKNIIPKLYKIKIDNLNKPDGSETTLKRKLEQQQRSEEQLSERLASLGIMEAYLRTPLNLLQHHGSIVSRGLMGAHLRVYLNPLEHHGSMVSRDLMGALDWAFIMARNFSLSNDNLSG